MKNQSVIHEAEKFVRSRLGNDTSGHDWWHAVRVRNIARTLQAEEGGDAFVIELATLLHDIGDRKVIGQVQDDHSITKNFLMNQSLESTVVDNIVHIISNMSFSKSLGNNNAKSESIEFQIVQDADRLDALGAIGIARAFVYGGHLGRPLYNPDYTAQRFTSHKEYVSTSDGSTLHHFDEKLFTLKSLLNTKSARSIAENRDDFMREFQRRFLSEWDGNV